MRGAEGGSPKLRALAWGVFGLSLVVAIAGTVVAGMWIADGRYTLGAAAAQMTILAPAAAFSIVGLVVALRRPRNPAGWLMLVIGGFWSGGAFPPDATPSTTWVGNLWLVPFGLMGTHLLLRLPDGDLPSPRWRPVSWLATTAIVFGIVTFPAADATNTPAWRGAVGVGLLGLLAACIIASVASLVVRARRASADEKHQIRWIATGGLAFLMSWLLAFVPQFFGATDTSPITLIAQNFALVMYACVPIGIGVAILRYRLYDVDVVLRKAVILATLAAFFTAVYALIVGGATVLIGSRSTPALSFLAAVCVAIGFQPVLARARRFADRVVYGKRTTPYEVLAAFGERMGEAYVDDDVLPRMAHVLGEGVGATRARVWLRIGEQLRPVATWPGDADAALADEHTVEVRHQGEVLGALSVAMPANDPMDPSKQRLVDDLASQAALVFRNVRLTEELRARLEDLKAAQKRLVAAQDDERRKLERNIHDGAQQQLVAMSVKLRLADGMVDRDPERARGLVAELQTETAEALEDLRDLARGIYPPLLADQGLAVALEAQARKASLPVEVRAGELGRYPPEIEAATYFSCLEALQNVAKYAAASAALVTVSDGTGALRFEVTDDGRGFDPARTVYGTGLQGIADRLAALDGTLSVSSAAGQGTTVAGEIPIL